MDVMFSKHISAS